MKRIPAIGLFLALVSANSAFAYPCPEFTFVPIPSNAPAWEGADYFGAYAGLLAILWGMLGLLVWGWAKMGGKAKFVNVLAWIGVFAVVYWVLMFRFRSHAYSPPLSDREWPIGLAVVFLSVAGTFWLGKIRIRGFASHSPLTVPRFMVGMLCWMAAAWLVTGLVGRPLGPLEGLFDREAKSGFAQVRGGAASPNKGGCDIAPRNWLADVWFGETEELFCRFYDPCEAAGIAQQQGKVLLTIFDGYSVASVRWWEVELFQNPRVVQFLNDHFIFNQVIVDDATKFPEPISTPDGHRLKTRGDAVLLLEETWIHQNVQPIIVLSRVRSGKVEALLPVLYLHAFPHSPELFLDYLEEGVAAFGK